jgi:ubiquinone/menaquinone biosynthesis C-methylase UbiE
MLWFENIDKNKKILDFGTGPGWAVFVGLNMGFDIIGIDLDKFKWKLSECLGVNKHIILYNGSKLPFSNNMFDLILCKAVLNKTDNLEIDKERELQRILKNAGMILISPSRHLKYLKNVENKDHLKFSKNREFKDKALLCLYKDLCEIAKSNIDSIDWKRCTGYIDCCGEEDDTK